MPSLEWHTRVDSTNGAARKLAEAGAPHGTGVAARTQSGGRGRGERGWASPPGGLYLSIVVRPRLRSERWGLLSLAAGLGAAEAVEALAEGEARREAVQVGLKWPNDLQLRGRKLGGVLCQGVPGDYGVVGVGLNLNTPPEALPPSVRAMAISLKRVTGQEVELEWAAEGVRAGVLERVAGLESAASGVLEAYAARCVTLGRRVKWEGGQGVALGLDPRGGLAVTMEGSRGERRVLTQEVHLEPD